MGASIPLACPGPLCVFEGLVQATIPCIVELIVRKTHDQEGLCSIHMIKNMHSDNLKISLPNQQPKSSCQISMSTKNVEQLYFSGDRESRIRSQPFLIMVEDRCVDSLKCLISFHSMV